MEKALEILRAKLAEHKKSTSCFTEAEASFKDGVESGLQSAIEILESLEKSNPTEEDVLNTIFSSVDIRGIDLSDYSANFSNERSGLYEALNNLFI